MVISVDPVAAWARSGAMALTGLPGSPPVVPPGDAASNAMELADWIAAATAGQGTPVRLDGSRLLSERAAYIGGRRQGAVSVGGHCRLLPTADGWAAVSCAREDDRLLLGALVGSVLGEDPWPVVSTWLREHTGAELAEGVTLLGLAAGPVCRASEPPVAPRPGHPRSVAGLRVVDFSALWAGPLCAHVLGLAGAQVTKVETPHRPDGARRGSPDFYRLLNAGHASVVLDPDDPGQRAELADLVAAADIVIEASRPRALAGFGLDAEASVASGTTWISITAYGRGVDRVGFGDDVAAASGLVATAPDGTPVFCGDALADPLTGLTAAALAMSGPPGRLHDVAMSTVVAATLGAEGAPPTAYRRGDVWLVDTGHGPVEVAEPGRRPNR